jgi:hypothetical protein
MTIHLPNDIELDILAAVQCGKFESVDAALAEAWREYRHNHRLPAPRPGQGLIGALREDAELLDQAVEHAMQVRESQPWRPSPGE